MSLDHDLEHRDCLCGLLLMMDIRHPLKDYDRQMLCWAAQIMLPVHILLTKADKLKRGPATNILHQVVAALPTLHPLSSAQTFSSLKKTGIDEAHAKLDTWFAE